MTFYISEFWCGVIVTILAELAALILYSIYLNRKHEDGEEQEDKEK